jgi:formylglycine-generating enzyme required for sulfatase activity
MLSRCCVSIALAGLLPVQAIGQDDTRGVEVISVDDQAASVGYANRHALIIGIDEYENPGYPDLSYAVADAQGIAKVLVERFGFPEDRVRLILNEDASKNGIESALQDWACDESSIGEQDLLVVFFAGHGTTRRYAGGTKAKGYLVPVDGQVRPNGDRVWGSLVEMEDFENASELMPAKHVLFLLDCCFGGLVQSRATTPIAAGLVNRARQIITAGGEDQAVADAGGSGHSIFTQEVLDALNGDADLNSDQVITFGELFNHVGRSVQSMTAGHQTPLLATFPDHGGGCVSLFPPDVTPRPLNASDRLLELTLSLEEKEKLLDQFEDVSIARRLLSDADELWPRRPVLTPWYREWLAGARGLLARRSEHEEWLRRTRQEAYLQQVVAGHLKGDAEEPDWDRVEPALQFRYQLFTDLLGDLHEVEELISDIKSRLEVADTIVQRSIGDYQEEWEEAQFFIADSATYGGLVLPPQIGLAPIGPDPESGLWEFWHLESGEQPIRNAATGTLAVTGKSGIVLVLLPGGTFWMGSTQESEGPNYDPQAKSQEKLEEVTLSQFFLSKYEMTQGQWLRIMQDNPSFFGLDHSWTEKDWAVHPIESVDWHQSREALRRLGLSLPTEAQWEYGGRAGTDTPWWAGNAIRDLRGAGNLADQRYERRFTTSVQGHSWDDRHAAHAPVGSFRGNAYGLYDTMGNVWEWCLDAYVADPAPARIGDGLRAYEVADRPTLRVPRGGGFSHTAMQARSAYRGRDAPEYRLNALGVRPARMFDP